MNIEKKHEGRHGSGHWIVMKVTSFALVPLGIWFAVSLVGLVDADQQQVRAFLQQPLQAGLMLMFLVTMLHHSASGIEEVVQDYLGEGAVKKAVLILNKLAHLAAALLAVTSVLSIVLKD
jgi:succinate dehydrogenase / fumarate reductase membrane anchor subunit